MSSDFTKPSENLAEAALQSIERDSKFLFALGEQFRTTASAREIFASVARAVGEYLDVQRCNFVDVDQERDRLVVHADFNTGPSVVGTYPVSSFSPTTVAAHRSGRSVVYSDALTDPRTAPFYEVRYRPLHIRAAISIPLLRNGDWVGLMAVTSSSPRDWTPREIGLLQTVAERTWLWAEHLQMVDALRASRDELERRVQERTAALERSNRDLEEFAYVASHDRRRRPGIEPRFHERVFQMFQTLRPRDEVEGAGIGLALVRRLIEQHGGRIALESEGGRGARFRFTWPKAHPDRAHGYGSSTSRQ